MGQVIFNFDKKRIVLSRPQDILRQKYKINVKYRYLTVRGGIFKASAKDMGDFNARENQKLLPVRRSQRGSLSVPIQRTEGLVFFMRAVLNDHDT